MRLTLAFPQLHVLLLQSGDVQSQSVPIAAGCHCLQRADRLRYTIYKHDPRDVNKYGQCRCCCDSIQSAERRDPMTFGAYNFIKLESKVILYLKYYFTNFMV